ncbi:alpha/beta hydrolase [Ligilactobacillus sp. Marseille-Q7487]|uniref:alpha/beta hydrolase n=1 Tax=Ligilactobacillus sp. Marseille-Q7487 TaxID=3022128 RepID=UPI0024A97B60|nr:alpha/beta hydrolase [Ligilactobacillus sp. Marseille-Q7487]
MISLENAAKMICEQQHPFLPTSIGIEVWRQRFALEQEKQVYLHEVDMYCEKIVAPNLPAFGVKLFFPKGHNLSQRLPVVYYIHGGQFMRGDAQTYHKLIAELTMRANVCLVFVEYALAPEQKAPVQFLQSQEGFLALEKLALKYPLDLNRLILVGDDVGASIAVSLAVKHKDAKIYKLVLFTPVVNANFDTSSYHSFAGGYDLSREQMKWAWEQYLGANASTDPLFSPLLWSKQDLATLPKTLLITAEADVVRDEGEALGRKMRDAGVEVAQVRIQGIIHDFVVKHSLDKTNACRIAMNLAVDWIRKKDYK